MIVCCICAQMIVGEMGIISIVPGQFRRVDERILKGGLQRRRFHFDHALYGIMMISRDDDTFPHSGGTSGYSTDWIIVHNRSAFGQFISELRRSREFLRLWSPSHLLSGYSFLMSLSRY